ncbi:Spore Coat Protein U domain-containing protein [Burkholderiales bacterium 8X]|nr:Spore Coat Protein U domain-containing protein [Burkholderiales bacterium 8X]
MRRAGWKWLACCAAALFGIEADAGCAALGVVGCSATIRTANLVFGNYNPTHAAPLYVTGSIQVTGMVTGVGLLTTMSYDISLSEGTDSTVAARRLTGPSGSLLGYNLYADASYATVWGNATVSDSFSAVATVLGTTVPRSYSVYGRLPANQYVRPGSYANSITVTVSF